MYSYDDEFTYTIDGETEYFTCIGNVKIKDNEYIIAESEYGQKRLLGLMKMKKKFTLLTKKKKN